MATVDSRKLIKYNFMYLLSKWFSFNVLKVATYEEKVLFRKTENALVKSIKKQNDIIFNKFCLDNNLSPTYTNICLIVTKCELNELLKLHNLIL